MLARFVFAVALSIGAILPGRADVATVPDPDKWIGQALTDISATRTDQFARNFVTLIDKPASFEALAGGLRNLSQLGTPVFIEKVVDVKFGEALREVIYLALYRRTEYVYFRFIIKKNVGGWLISDFAFKSEASDLFPKDFATFK